MQIRTGDPEMAREINRALILDLLRKHEALSRAQIARLLDVSKATVSTVTSQLLDQQFVSEVGEGNAPKQGGRKPILLALDTASQFVIGVDVGYTNTVVGVGNLKGELLARLAQPTARSHTVEHVLDQVDTLIANIISQSNIPREKILGLGISVAGMVEKTRGLITISPDFNWHDVQIVNVLQERSQFSAVADNCTRAMTLGEIRYGRAKNVRNMFYVNVGYGIGSAFVINGRIYNNHSEFGHVFVTQKKDAHCDCGKTGCLEAVSSGHAIERMANAVMKDTQNGWITAKVVADLASQGDAAAQTILHAAGKYLGRSLAAIANCFNPDKIIIGGGVALADRLLLDSVLEEYATRTMEMIAQHVRIELSSLAGDAGIIGAIALALDNFVFKQDTIDCAWNRP